MTHGWHTQQTEGGFRWSVHQMVWDADLGRAVMTNLKTGSAATRARAAGAAKRWVLFFRRGGKL